MFSNDDRLEIIALYRAYNDAIDAHDAAGWSRLFSEGGRFVHPARLYEGEQELAGFVIERAKRLAETIGETQRHWNDRIDISGDGATATGSCDLLVVTRPDDGGMIKVVATGRYEDRLAKQAGAWCFIERRLTVE